MDPFLCSPNRLEELHGSAMVGVRDEFGGGGEKEGSRQTDATLQKSAERFQTAFGLLRACEAKNHCRSLWCYPQGCMKMVTSTDRFVVKHLTESFVFLSGSSHAKTSLQNHAVGDAIGNSYQWPLPPLCPKAMAPLSAFSVEEGASSWRDKAL